MITLRSLFLRLSFFNSKEDVAFHLEAFDYFHVKQEINHAKIYLIVAFSATEFCE